MYFMMDRSWVIFCFRFLKTLKSKTNHIIKFYFRSCRVHAVRGAAAVHRVASLQPDRPQQQDDPQHQVQQGRVGRHHCRGTSSYITNIVIQHFLVTYNLNSYSFGYFRA